MSVELSYQSYDDKSLIVFGDRRKYQKQINLLGGRWNSRKEGWLLPIGNQNKLDGFISSLTPDETVHEKKYHREESDSESNDSEKDDEVIPLEKLSELEPKLEPKLELKPEDDNKSRQSNQSSERLKDDNERRILDYRRREEENRLRERRKREELKRREEEENHAKRKYGKQDPMIFNKSFKEDSDEEDNPYEYYKSFNKKPIDFRRMHDISDSEDGSDSVEESSDYSESSSDGFPSPNTPRRRDDYRKTDHKTYNELYNKVQDLQRRVSEMEISSKRRR